MMSNIQEKYAYRAVGVNASVTLNNRSVGGFLPTTTGTVSLTDGNGQPVFSGVPVTAGVYLPLPFILQTTNAVFTTAGGASGTLAVGG